MTNIPQATPESEWAELRKILRELAEKNRELGEMNRELAERQVENERILTEKFAENERQRREDERQRKEDERQMKEKERFLIERQAETDRQIKKVNETLGSWANNHGSFAEEYFFNSFEKGKRNFFGENFDEIEKNVKGIKSGAKDEYDILLLNGKSIGIIETKYKAHENDIPKIVKKAETFRINFPEYAGHQVYLGLATMAFYPELEQLCISEGIAIIKQAGDTVVVNDEHLKVF